MAQSVTIIPEVVRGRAPRPPTPCPYMAGDCSQCPRLGQGVVAGGYTYVDPVTNTVVTIQEGTESGWQSELQTFLDETSPIFGFEWKWVILAGFGAWWMTRKDRR